MGYYLQTPSNLGKAQHLIDNEGASICGQTAAGNAVDHPTLAPLVVVNNGMFEAVGLIFSKREFEAFTEPSDTRPKEFLLMDRERAEVLAGYHRVE